MNNIKEILNKFHNNRKYNGYKNVMVMKFQMEWKMIDLFILKILK